MGGNSQSSEHQEDSESVDETTNGATSTGTTRYGVSSGTGTKSQLGYDVDELGRPVERTIYFAFDSEKIDPKYSDILDGHADYLKENNDTRIILQGHSDERGTREYNMALSERRALSVRKFLRMLGVPSRKISIVSYGEERPAIHSNTEDGHSENRRVILKY
jgi:peptidoglycan-associated lipoprotein